MKVATLFLFFLVAVNIAVAKIEIAEIMYNPEDSNEWVEFFNFGDEIDIGGMEISDNYQTDKILCCTENCSFIVPGNSYFLIVEKDTTLNLTGRQFFCVDDSAIGNGLGNTEDRIELSQNNETILIFSYNTTTDKGKSFALINDTWMQAFPTPGEINTITYNIPTEEPEKAGIEIVFQEGPFYAFVNYNSLANLHNLDYSSSSGYLNFTVYTTLYSENNESYLLFEETENVSFKHTKQLSIDISLNQAGDYVICTELFNSTDVQYEKKCANITFYDPRSVQCDVSLDMEVEKIIFDENESIAFDNIMSNDTFPFEIEYWVEDLFGNEVKERYKTTNLNKKQFSPDFEETDKVYVIKSNLTKMFCNNSNNETYTEQIVIVKGETVEKNNQSRIIIIETAEETSFGDILEVELDIFKGETRKTLVEAYLKGEEKVSQVTGLKINEKYSEAKVSLPIQLKDNCDGRYKEGNYLLIVEGLDCYSEKQVYVKKNEDCPEAKKIAKSTSSSSRGPPAQQSSAPKEKMYELLSLIQDVFSSEVIATVKIYNKENKTHSYEIWSYLYKGATSYSGEREGNKQKLLLEPFSDETVSLRSKVSATHPEDVLLKIKILREDRKTPYEITQNITIDIQSLTNNTENRTQENLAKVSKPELYSEQGKQDSDMINAISSSEEKEDGGEGERITGSVIYESKTEKIKGYGIFFMSLAVLLGVVAFVKLRPKKENII